MDLGRRFARSDVRLPDRALTLMPGDRRGEPRHAPGQGALLVLAVLGALESSAKLPDYPTFTLTPPSPIPAVVEIRIQCQQGTTWRSESYPPPASWPLRFSWTDMKDGLWSCTAKAKDAAGLWSYSPTISLTVKDGRVPEAPSGFRVASR